VVRPHMRRSPAIVISLARLNPLPPVAQAKRDRVFVSRKASSSLPHFESVPPPRAPSRVNPTRPTDLPTRCYSIPDLLARSE
jgi:hypothetical protein